MKRLIVVASVLLWLGCVVATAALARFARPPADSGLTLLFTSGTTMAIAFTTVILGQILSNRMDPALPTARGLYRRLGWVVVVGLALSSALPIVGGVLLHSPVWVPTALVALTVLSSALPVAAAVHYRRRLPATPTDGDAWRLDIDVTRTFRRIAITFVIATAACAVALAIVAGTGVDDSLNVAEVTSFSLGLGAFCAAAPAVVSAWRLNSSISDIFGATDRRVNRKVSRVVVRGKPEHLTASELAMAAKLAHVWREYMPVAYAQTALVIAGVFLLELPNLLLGDTEPIVIALFALTAVMMLLVVSIGSYQYRFVRRYSDAHPVDDGVVAA